MLHVRVGIGYADLFFVSVTLNGKKGRRSRSVSVVLLFDLRGNRQFVTRSNDVLFV